MVTSITKNLKEIWAKCCFLLMLTRNKSNIIGRLRIRKIFLMFKAPLKNLPFSQLNLHYSKIGVLFFSFWSLQESINTGPFNFFVVRTVYGVRGRSVLRGSPDFDPIPRVYPRLRPLSPVLPVPRIDEDASRPRRYRGVDFLTVFRTDFRAVKETWPDFFGAPPVRPAQPPPSKVPCQGAEPGIAAAGGPQKFSILARPTGLAWLLSPSLSELAMA